MSSPTNIFDNFVCYLYYNNPICIISPCEHLIFIHLVRIAFYKKYGKDLLEGKEYSIHKSSKYYSESIVDNSFTNINHIHHMNKHSSIVNKIPRIQKCFDYINKLLNLSEYTSSYMRLSAVLSSTHTFSSSSMFTRPYTTEDLHKDAKAWKSNLIYTTIK